MLRGRMEKVCTSCHCVGSTTTDAGDNTRAAELSATVARTVTGNSGLVRSEKDTVDAMESTARTMPRTNDAPVNCTPAISELRTSTPTTPGADSA
jgi:hypothetical protein